MAIANKYRSASDENEISLEEFKNWLKKFDTDRDGRISVEELQAAVRAAGGWWFTSKRKAKRGVKMADADFNGFVDDHEINNLVEFAKKNLGIRITSV